MDDASEENAIGMAKHLNVNIFSKEKGMGLTHSWNLAYKKFRDEGYEVLIIANNDILVPKEALKPILSLSEKYAVVVPLSTRHGAGHEWKYQSVSMHYIIEGVNNPSKY